jgi:hypothetical protein
VKSFSIDSRVSGRIDLLNAPGIPTWQVTSG